MTSKSRNQIFAASRAMTSICVAATIALAGSALASPKNTPDLEPLPKAFAAQDAKDWVGASKFVAKQPQIVRDLVQWRFVSTSNSGATFDEISAFLTAHANWPGRGPITQRGEEALLAENLMESKGAQWFKAHPARTSSACLALTKFQFSHEQKSEAVANIKRCWLALTLTFADYQDWTTFSSLPLAEGDHLARVDTLLWNKSVSAARELLPLLPGKANTTASARVLTQSGSMIDLDDAIEAAPSTAWAASLIYDQALLLKKTGKAKDSWTQLLKADDTAALPLQYSQFWWPEHNSAARSARDTKENDIAYRLASRTHLTADTNVVAYLDSEFLAGWIALRSLDEPKKAMVHFQHLEAAAKSPVTRARAAYWKALAFKADGKESQAQQSLAMAATEPATFYGRLALEMQKEPRSGTGFSPKPSTTSASENTEELVHAAEILLLSGDVRRANAFANAAIDVCQSTGCATPLSVRLAKSGNTYGALRAAKKAQTLGVSRIDQLFPLLDLPASCSASGVPPSLILALIRQESEFDPSAMSSANAHGLMQLLPSTAQDVARRYKLAYAGAKDLVVPETNLTIGCYHVKDLLDTFQGSYLLTIASYNAGKGRISGWISAHGDPREAKVDAVDWVEAIPFDETRNYVMRVLENELTYKTRLGQPLQPQELNQALHRKS